MTLTERILNRVIDLARRTPYFHLYHADGTLYMERYWVIRDAKSRVAHWEIEPLVWLFQKLGICIRLHCIHSPDLDREMHDHPWTFFSVVLRGWYEEARPYFPERAEFLGGALGSGMELRLSEPSTTTHRAAGSYALRRFYHRHRITAVSPGGVWTLFVTFRKRQVWGFYTEQGKVWWWKFESVHNNNNNNNQPVA